ncbi:unnamed protein product, partial [Effrenium voratum]
PGHAPGAAGTVRAGAAGGQSRTRQDFVARHHAGPEAHALGEAGCQGYETHDPPQGDEGRLQGWLRRLGEAQGQELGVHGEGGSTAAARAGAVPVR